MEWPRLPKPDFRIDYRHMAFVWVSNHYDVHLSGLCRVGGELMRFTTIEHHSFARRLRCHVFRMGRKEKLRWWLRKRIFEICVGYHWTYPHRGQGVRYYIRSPRWLYRLLGRWYFGFRRRVK